MENENSYTMNLFSISSLLTLDASDTFQEKMTKSIITTILLRSGYFLINGSARRKMASEIFIEGGFLLIFIIFLRF